MATRFYRGQSGLPVARFVHFCVSYTAATRRDPRGLQSATSTARGDMATCTVCGNDYDKSFTITMHDGTQHAFDSFECAIHALAPSCAHCGCRIIGHDLEANGSYYCCDHCARSAGVTGLEDRVGDAGA